MSSRRVILEAILEGSIDHVVLLRGWGGHTEAADQAADKRDQVPFGKLGFPQGFLKPTPEHGLVFK